MVFCISCNRLVINKCNNPLICQQEQTNWTGAEPFIKYMNKSPIVRNEQEVDKMYCMSCDRAVDCGCTRLDCQFSQEIKMTRQEAIMKMPMGFENLPAALEALGLIKFEKEKEIIIDNALKAAVTYGRRDTNWQDFDGFVKKLGDQGYKIVKEQT